MIHTDIEAHRPAVESVQQVAATYLETSKPSEAKDVMSKLDNINSRYATISDVTDKHGDQLRLLQSRLNDFDREVDQLEDWEIPVIEALEGRDVMKMDMNQLSRKINVRPSRNLRTTTQSVGVILIVNYYQL